MRKVMVATSPARSMLSLSVLAPSERAVELVKVKTGWVLFNKVKASSLVSTMVLIMPA